MEQYIRAIEKQIIAKLYERHALEIETANGIIGEDEQCGLDGIKLQ